jgi:hypothetical protein
MGVGFGMRTRRDARKQKTRLSHLTEALLRGDRTALRRIERALHLHLPQIERPGKTGATGPRGPQAPAVLPERSASAVKIRKPGTKGPKGPTSPFPENNVMAMVVTHFETVYRQLNEQLRLIAKIQEQLNGLSRPSV